MSIAITSADLQQRKANSETGGAKKKAKPRKTVKAGEEQAANADEEEIDIKAEAEEETDI